ncbi:hypothetical protein [Streptomyces sp. NPDC059649]|uniref:hypothetical protein n=1 Tax=Streptomyces sp. NPDC059649 TaxID=3346895 RepID=UPI00368EEF28
MPKISTTQKERDRDGQRNICAACGHPGSDAADQLLVADGFRIHRSHTTDPCSGYYRGQR